ATRKPKRSRIRRPNRSPNRSPTPNPNRSPNRRPPSERTRELAGPARPGLFISAAVKKHFVSGALRRYFITGLLIWIPLIITLWVLKVIFDTLDASLLLLPDSFQTERWLGMHIPGLG